MPSNDVRKASIQHSVERREITILEGERRIGELMSLRQVGIGSNMHVEGLI